MAGSEERPWAENAKCRGLNPAFFFPVVKGRDGLPLIDSKGAEKPDLAGVTRAKEFCNGEQHEFDKVCPVRTECLHWAIRNGYWEGVYGGMVERERRAYARKKRAGIGFRTYSFGGSAQAAPRSWED